MISAYYFPHNTIPRLFLNLNDEFSVNIAYSRIINVSIKCVISTYPCFLKMRNHLMTPSAQDRAVETVKPLPRVLRTAGQRRRRGRGWI